MAVSGGGSGLLSVPDAGVLPVGVGEYQHNNGIMPFSEGGLFSRADSTDRALVDSLHVGLFPRVEFGARLTTWYDQVTGRRTNNDLSAHLKLQLVNTERFRLAVGSRDLEGEEGGQKFPGNFVTADWRHDKWQFVAGFGESSLDNIALDGPFGGLRYAATPWLELLSDYDGIGFNNGLRLHGRWKGVGGYLQAYHTTNDLQTVVMAAGLRMQLGSVRKTRISAPSQKATEEVTGLGAAKPQAESFALRQTGDSARYRSPSNSAAPADAADGVTQRLEFLKYRDGAHVLLQARDDLASRCSNQQFVATSNAVPTVSVGCDAQGMPKVQWQTQWHEWERGFGWVQATPVSLRIDPALRYAVGTEFGRVDISSAARVSAEWHSPLGLGGYYAYNVAIGATDDYRNSRTLGRGEIETGFSERAAQWTLHPYSGIFLQGTAGTTRFNDRDLDFRNGEVSLLLAQGRVGLNYQSTTFDNRPAEITDHQELFTAFAWLWNTRVALNYTYGTWAFDDQGSRTDLLSYFGRVRVGLYLKEGDGQKAAGVQVSIPLTPRVAWGGTGWAVSGNSHFAPGLETQIDNDDGRNTLRPNFLNRFVPQRNLTDNILDQWRLTPYFVRHQSLDQL